MPTSFPLNAVQRVQLQSLGEKAMGLARMNTQRFFMITILCASGLGHAADSWDFAMEHKNRCSEGSQLDMNLCLKAAAAKVERRLKDLQSTLVKQLVDPGSAIRADRSWQRFREDECAFSNSGLEEGNSLYQYAALACRIDLGEKRIRDLERHVEESCNGCPPKK